MIIDPISYAIAEQASLWSISRTVPNDFSIIRNCSEIFRQL
jgi:hypothetical protein